MKPCHGIAIFIIFLTSALSAQTSWNWKNPNPQGNTLRSLIVKADSFGVAVGDVGTTVKRSSGSFQSVTFPVTTKLGGICYYKDTIWIAGDGGIIKRSADNG